MKTGAFQRNIKGLWYNCWFSIQYPLDTRGGIGGKKHSSSGCYLIVMSSDYLQHFFVLFESLTLVFLFQNGNSVCLFDIEVVRCAVPKPSKHSSCVKLIKIHYLWLTLILLRTAKHAYSTLKILLQSDYGHHHQHCNAKFYRQWQRNRLIKLAEVLIFSLIFMYSHLIYLDFLYYITLHVFYHLFFLPISST